MSAAAKAAVVKVASSFFFIAIFRLINAAPRLRARRIGRSAANLPLVAPFLEISLDAFMNTRPHYIASGASPHYLSQITTHAIGVTKVAR